MRGSGGGLSSEGVQRHLAGIVGHSCTDKIRSSIAFVQDLVATDLNFRTNKQVPVTKQQIKA